MAKDQTSFLMTAAMQRCSYPFPLGEDVPGHLIASLEGLDDASRGRLNAGTALEFLALEPDRFHGEGTGS